MRALINLIGGQVLPEEEDGPATRLRLAVTATLASAFFAALYGLAAGSTDLSLALSNVYKMPMVIVLSALCAVPAGLLTWKLLGGRGHASSLLMSQAAGTMTGTLVLAALAPIVALYYHTSGYLGGTLALATGGLALAVGLAVHVRALAKRTPSGSGLAARGPAVVMMVVQMAAMIQFIHVASPILPELTVFDGGMDAIVRQ
ncbi:MAG: hypothetical protein H6741_17255 [Alphaproteobacteria bacterium]|nr:hypothetical protein [Alphaproteobacteria bacterium]MCB9794465.1 hypothetical protein [Alphaproteobacteria bacterium]